jgi:hypothetical protein
MYKLVDAGVVEVQPPLAKVPPFTLMEVPDPNDV